MRSYAHLLRAPHVFALLAAATFARLPICERTGKAMFRDRIAAELALSQRVRKGKGEERAYKCEFCHKWHLTSQRRRGND